MYLDWITLNRFRSYGELEWRPDPGVNLLVGRNGAGKTNVLEAVAYLPQLRSFRNAPDAALVGFDADRAVIRAETIGRDDRRSLIEIELGAGRSRRTQVNRQRLARTADLMGHVRAVTFLPEDLDIVKRGPAGRRDLLDDVAVALAPSAALDQSEFDRSLRQRNAFLRQGDHDLTTLSVWDERLSLAAGKVMARRARAASSIQPHLRAAYRNISGSDVTVEWHYESDWGGSLDPAVAAAVFTSAYLETLDRRRRADRERRVTTTGPHRDDPVLRLDGHDLRYHGSQGEQRTAALALRLAGHSVVRQEVDVTPILILDDVFSELDDDRSEALASALPDGQTLISTADRSDVPLDGVLWQVDDGSIRRGSSR